MLYFRSKQMSKYVSVPTLLSTELAKFGLLGRINLCGINPELVEVYSEEHGCASPFEGNRGCLTSFATGPMLYSWAGAGGKAGGYRFKLNTGYAVCIIGENSSNLQLQLRQIC
jgi:hypothetical protein